MLSYDMTKNGSDSLYHYLYKCIKNDVLQGTLAAGDKLPTKRPFAEHLGVSVITVENAYAQLLTEGFIYSEPRKGFFVADIVEKLKKSGLAASLSQQNFPESRESRRYSTPDELRPRFQRLHSRARGKIIADFTSNQSETSAFPFSTWAKIMRKVLCEQQNELLERSPYGGVLPLRVVIAKMLKGTRNLDVSPDQIIVGAGTDYLYGLLVQLLGFNKKYGVEDPGYSKISKIYRKLNVVCNFIPLDEQGVRIDQLEETCTDVVHLSPSHHFPTGIVTPVSRRYELLSWAAKSSNRYIVEDDYDSEFRMVGKPIPALQNIDVQEKVVYINSFSKTLASTVRVSYMVLPRSLAEKFHKEFSFYTCTVSNFEQLALARYIGEGHFEKHVNRMRNFYRHRRDALLSAIRKSKLRDFASISEEDAGLHFILKINTALSDEEFCNAAKEKGVVIGALSDYYTQAEPSAHQFIMNYSAVPEKQMPRAMEKLYEVVKSIS